MLYIQDEYEGAGTVNGLRLVHGHGLPQLLALLDGGEEGVVHLLLEMWLGGLDALCIRGFDIMHPFPLG